MFSVCTCMSVFVWEDWEILFIVWWNWEKKTFFNPNVDIYRFKVMKTNLQFSLPFFTKNIQESKDICVQLICALEKNRNSVRTHSDSWCDCSFMVRSCFSGTVTIKNVNLKKCFIVKIAGLVFILLQYMLVYKLTQIDVN